jgi:hypothetical protein
MRVPISCEEVWREVSNYIEGGVDAGLRERMEKHFRSCKHCSAVLDGTRNLVGLVGDGRSFTPPKGFSGRLQARLAERGAAPPGESATVEMEMGITADRVPLGSHLIYFWETEQDFARGVRFFYPGLDKGEHCIAFGHDEALERVQQTLRSEGYDPERLQKERKLTILRRQSAAPTTLSDISAILEAAQRAGARAVRFLGNLGMERDPLPAGEDDVLQLEHQVDTVIGRYPCVVVCMYDVRTLPGRMILKGGLEQHRLAVCAEGVHENPYYVAEQGPASMRHIH